MNTRQSFHIFKILEDFSKQYISFEYSPEYKLPSNYYLSYQEVENTLKDNATLIQALYDRNEKNILSILSHERILIDEFEDAQLDENSSNKKDNIKRTPLPIQARYVLQAWNMLRINSPISEKEALLSIFNKPAFKNSFYPQISKMALAFENISFKSIALKTLSICNSNEQLYLFYKILGYYFRINGQDKQKKSCQLLSTSYSNNLVENKDLINSIKNELK